MNSNDISKPRNHLAYIDTIRFLAAVYVMLGHMTSNIRVGETYKGVLYYLFYFPHYAVVVFLVISGYCLMLPLVQVERLKKGWPEFFYRRCRRILPPYFITVGLCLVLIMFTPLGRITGTVWDSSIGSGINLKSVLLHFFMLQDAFTDTDHQINYVLWSVAVEFRIYMLFGLFLWSWRRFGPLTTTGIVCVGSLGLAYLIPSMFKTLANHHIIPSELHDVTPMFVWFCGLFVIGMLAATVTSSSRSRFSNLFACQNWNRICLGATCALLVFCTAQFVPQCNRFLPHGGAADDFVGLWAATVLIWACSTKSQTMPVRKWLNNRCLAFMGGFSYSIYLMHPLLLQIMWMYVVHPMHLSLANETWVLCSLGAIVCVAGSYVFHLIAEKPFMNVRK